MMKRIVSLLLSVLILLSGCGGGQEEETTQPSDAPSLPTSGQSTESASEETWPEEELITYDWMAGESPVPNRRIGLLRQGLNHISPAVSESGTYFIYNTDWIVDVTPPSPWILYVDHGSDMVIKLCGRPDCTHDTTDCNAYVEDAEHLSYYDGNLYVFSCGHDLIGTSWEQRCTLLKMSPDGTERTEVFDFREFAQEQGNDGASCFLVNDGYCVISTYDYITVQQPDGSTSTTTEERGTYRYKLDGSMEQPEELTSQGMPCYQCGDVMLTWYPESEKGGEYGSYWDLDLETDTLTFLTDHPGTPGYYDKEEGYYFKDGGVHRLTYATGKDEVVLKTELTGTYHMLCFPDCFILADGEIRNEKPDLNLYIYNWAFEPVDTIKINFPCDVFMVSKLVIGETPDQIILSNGTSQPMPTYYINKAELGTDDAQIHKYEMPDLEYDLQRLEEEQEDQEWFENG